MRLIKAISLQNQGRHDTSSPGVGGDDESHMNDIKTHWGKATRLEFSKFDGNEFEEWLMRTEYFFEVAEVVDEEKVKLAALHLEGKALQWHRGYVGLRKELAYGDWSSYVHAMSTRFGVKAYEDPLADLRNLKQVSSLKEYMDSYDALYPRTGIREDQAISFFLSGLVDELQMLVCMFKPRTLDYAYALAKLQEITVAALHNKPRSSGSNHSYASTYSSNVKSLTITAPSYKPSNPTANSKDNSKAGINVPPPRVTPRITNKEMDERRLKGLCFWCDEKYTPSHKCPKKILYVMQLVEEEEGEEKQPEEEETITELQLSVHAMWGLEGSQIMKIKGESHKKSLKILIDTGSTHNFLSAQVSKKMNCALVKVLPASVEVANGQ